jgi:hypothetical protein
MPHVHVIAEGLIESSGESAADGFRDIVFVHEEGEGLSETLVVCGGSNARVSGNGPVVIKI